MQQKHFRVYPYRLIRTERTVCRLEGSVLRRLPMKAVALLLVMFLSGTVSYAAVAVNSQEQFARRRLKGWPKELTYNFERAYLEVHDGNCPARSKAFFSLHISKEGEVKSVRGRLLSLSAGVKNVGLKWADAILKEMRFRPLLYGNDASAVDTAVTLVCVE